MDITISVAEVRDEGYEADEILIEMDAPTRWAGSDTAWQALLRVLISVCPPEQDWERTRDSFENIAEPGWCLKRIDELRELASRGRLAESQAGDHSHFAHTKDLADCTVEGRAVHALCGAWFVPTQDHQCLPRCVNCDHLMATIEASTDS